MKKLLFNLERTQPTATVKRHGGGIYGEIVFRRIVNRGLPVEGVYDSSRWFNPEIERLCKENKIKLYDLAAGKTMQGIVNESKADVFYTPLQLKELADLKDCKIVTTVHGLRDLELPVDMFAFKYRMNLKGLVRQTVFTLLPKWFRKRKQAGIAKFIDNPDIHLVTVSEHSRSSIRLFFPNQREKSMKVFYSPSTTNEEYIPESQSTKYTFPYFMMVSGNRWEKNNLRAIIALDRLYSEKAIPTDIKTIITGVKDSSIFRYKLKNPQQFHFMGYVDDNELTELYRNAFCFIYPTLNEGFGYPPLEAMRFGVPVLASPVTSVEEICGRGASYFNPLDIQEIEMRILRLFEPGVRTAMSEAALERYAQVKSRQDEDLDKLIDYIYG